jgi:isoamylase
VINIFKFSTNNNRTAYYWHIFIEGVKPGQLYGFRVNGPYRPYQGTAFSPKKVLLDPDGLLLEWGEKFSCKASIGRGSNIDSCLKKCGG